MQFYPNHKRNIFRYLEIGILIIFLILFSNKIKASEVLDSKKDFTKIEYQQEIVKLKINEKKISENIVVVRTEEGEWYLPKLILIENRIDCSAFNFVEYNGKDYVSILLFNDSEINFSQEKQELILKIDSKYFLGNDLYLSNSKKNNKILNESGLFINYDLSIDANSGNHNNAIFVELGKSFDIGVATSNVAHIESIEKNKLIRLDTTLTVDKLSEMSTIKIGDTISRPATILGRPVRYGGIHYGTNFQIQPQFVKAPTAFISSQAALPSTVDVFVNNTLQTRKEIPPGPFSISGVPLISGDGEVRMVITDISGRQQIISQRFYSSPTLLAKNISEFSIEVGYLRRNYGQENNDYNDFFASGSYRYGLTNNLTIEGGLQLQQGDNYGLQASITNTINNVGLISSAVAYSRTKFGNGGKFALGFERNMKEYSIGVNTQIAEDGYRQEGVDNDFNVKKINNINFLYRIKNIGNIGFSFIKQELVSGSKTEIFSSNFSTLQRSWGTLFFSIFGSSDSNKNYGISVFWVMPFERDLSSSLSHSQNRSQIRNDQTVLQVQRNISTTNNIGYRLQTGINVPNQAGLSTQNEYVYSRFEAAEFQGNNSFRLSLSGAIANFENQWFLTRRINESFGLVKIPGIPNVRVYVDNQLTAKTNKDGLAFVPRLSPYLPNKVSIEASDLPMDTEINNLLMSPVPAWRSGVTINFPIRRSSSASLNLIDERGTPLPAGAVAKINDREEEFPIGTEGEAYLTGLKEINQINVKWGDQSCSVIIPYSNNSNNINNFGDVVCKKN